MSYHDPRMKVFFDEADRLLSTDRKLKDIFEVETSTWPKNTIFIYQNEKGKRAKVSYTEFKQKCFVYADAIQRKLSSIERGSFVGLKLNNSPVWAYVFWGLIIAGYKPFLINPIINKKETSELLKEAGSNAIFTAEPENSNVFNPDCLELSGAIKEPVWENEIAFCTSGTTGKSRIYVFDGENLSYQIYAAWVMPETTDDIMYNSDLRLIAIVPFSHIFGFTAVYFWFSFFGRTIVFPKSNAPEHLVECCQKDKISHIFTVPLFWNKVAKMFKDTISKESDKKQALVSKFLDFNNRKLTKVEAGIAKSNLVRKVIQGKVLGTNVRYCISGGAYLSKDTLETINGLGYPLYNGYGMTEIGISSVETSPDVLQRNKGSVGKPLTNVEYKIKDGELCVKAPQVHKYNLINGKKVPAELDKEGFFHTGDIAEVDENGYYIKGKTKDIVIGDNGENIYPEEIENAFSDLSFVNNLSVVGLPSNGSEKLSLVIELSRKLEKEEIETLENEIAEANGQLPVAKQVQEFYLSTYPLPINASMKVMRYQIVDDFKNRPETFVKLDSGIQVSFEGLDENEVKEASEHLLEIFADVLNKDKNEISPSSHIVIDLGGDSFSYMSIIASIEYEFKIKIPTDLIGKLNSVNQFVDYILRHKNQE